MNIMKRILSMLKKRAKNPQETEMEYLIGHGLRIGRNFQSSTTYLFDSNFPWLITVGNDVTVSIDVKILAHDESTNHVGVPTKIGIVEIGDNVFIGAKSVILCNTRIGNNVIIGAGSVVSNDIPDHSVVAGNPAKVICTIEEFKQKHQQNLKNYPYFIQHKKDDWKKASPEQWTQMREELKDTFRYI